MSSFKHIPKKMNIPKELLDNDFLFHYSKSYVAMEKILYEKKIRFSSLINMNDPYEYKLPSLGVMGKGGVAEATASELTGKLRNTILYKAKILSLVRNKEVNSETDFQLVFAKPRLWAQYAEAQRGVCLVFSLTTFLEKIRAAYSDITIYNNFVEYDLQKGRRSSKNHLKYDKSKSPDENIQCHIHTNQKDIFFRKHEDFGDENEYRIVLINWTDKSNNDIFIDLRGILRAVILGERFHRTYETLIKTLTEQLNVNLYKIAYASNVYIQKIIGKKKTGPAHLSRQYIFSGSC